MCLKLLSTILKLRDRLKITFVIVNHYPGGSGYFDKITIFACKK